tara:strand:+ start:31 stop:225 length:195 start_codon:yes stop_codon:yes gene_type:complete
MPHMPFLDQLPHDPVFADIVKTLFILVASAYLQSQKVPDTYVLVLTTVVVILYHSVVKDMFPGK